MNQAPESDEEINEFCALNYQTSFPRFAKIDVNGDNASSLYRYLRHMKPEDEGKGAKDFKNRILKMITSSEDASINWNFTKFLVDGEGNVVHRYAPTVDPLDIKEDIFSLFNE